MSLRLRIIPITIIVTSLFLTVKLLDLIQGGQKLSESVFVSRVEAEEKPPEEKKTEEAPKEEKKSEEEHSEAKSDNPNVSNTPGEISDRRFTTVEIELLQKLSRRREELDTWESNLQIKEATLGATEKRIDDKIAQVEAMKKAVSEALAEYNKIEDTEISSLVKIYENMKPVDAARIFDELDRPILLLIVDRMSEKKASPILAAMDSKRAKTLTVDLAEQRRLESKTINTTNNATSPSAKPAAADAAAKK